MKRHARHSRFQGPQRIGGNGGKIIKQNIADASAGNDADRRPDRKSSMSSGVTGERTRPEAVVGGSRLA
jgi:hypothetical protein